MSATVEMFCCRQQSRLGDGTVQDWLAPSPAAANSCLVLKKPNVWERSPLECSKYGYELQGRLAQTQPSPLAMMGTAEDPGVVLVVYLTPSSGMSTLQQRFLPGEELLQDRSLCLFPLSFSAACVDK